MRAAILLVLCIPLGAHKFHYSKTEINWNSYAGSVEVVVTLHAEDLEQQLRKKRPQLELDRDAEAETLVCAYVAASLVFPSTPLRCLGMKVGRDFVDVFLEGAAPRPPSSLTNRLLVDSLDDQRNDVELRRDGKLTGPRSQFNTSETKKNLSW